MAISGLSDWNPCVFTFVLLCSSAYAIFGGISVTLR